MRIRALVVSGLAVASFLALAGSAGGGETTSFSYSPQSGPPGTVITVSGSGCATEVDTQVEVVLSTQAGVVIASGSSAVIPANSESGNWTVTLTVPAGTPPGTYDLQAFCTIVGGDSGDSVSALQVNPPAGNVGFITYTLANFVVTAPVPPATAPPTAPPGVGATPEDAPPAPPVAAAPRTAG